VAKRGKLPRVKSVRLADELYDAAQQEAALMSRSIAQQLEHWARLGAALEAAGVTAEQLRAILGGDQRTRERVFMKLGLESQERMLLVPPDTARRAKVTFPPRKALAVR
jgi:hypothetical protein